MILYTVIAKNIGTLAILSENVTLLSENCCSCKCFGTHMIIYFVSVGHVVRMADGRIPKDLLYGEWVQGNCPRGRPQLRYKDICKRDLKALEMDLNRWETLTSECSAWRQVVHLGLSQFEETLVQQAEAKRQSWKQQNQGAGQGTGCTSLQCRRDCHLNWPFSATLDTLPSPLYRARYHSLHFPCTNSP